MTSSYVRLLSGVFPVRMATRSAPSLEPCAQEAISSSVLMSSDTSRVIAPSASIVPTPDSLTSTIFRLQSSSSEARLRTFSIAVEILIISSEGKGFNGSPSAAISLSILFLAVSAASARSFNDVMNV